eukprot:12047634-Karenia_brevis.AAC.1
MVSPPAGATCQISKAGTTEEKCLQTIMAPCIHPHVCKAGPARLRPHRAVMVALKNVFTKAGAEVDLERAMPCLYTVAPTGVITEAILDD